MTVYSKKFAVPEWGFLILFPQSLSPLAETVVFFFQSFLSACSPSVKWVFNKKEKQSVVSVHSECMSSSTAGKKVKMRWSNTHALRAHMFRDETFVCLSTLYVMILLISGVFEIFNLVSSNSYRPCYNKFKKQHIRQVCYLYFEIKSLCIRTGDYLFFLHRFCPLLTDPIDLFI